MADTLSHQADPLNSIVAARLADVAAQGRLRRDISPPEGTDFLTNDYLGLRTHPAVAEAASRAAMLYGTGAGASRLLGGDLPILRRLESELASLKGTESALLFPSGYQANLALLSTIAGEGDGIWSDRLNHASIIDGCRLSRAAIHLFDHNSPASLDASLERHRTSVRVAVVVVEGVHSMDGDICPLPQFREVCERHGARLVVDDAHATGVLGRKGGGLHCRFGLAPGTDIIVGTLSKALGSQGAFICCPKNLREYLVNFARGYIFTTGLSPVSAACASAALGEIQGGSSLIERLHRNIALFASLISGMGISSEPETPIFPVILGSEVRALEVSRRLAGQGFSVGAVRPPAVQPGTSRLRITISARHSDEDIVTLATLLDRALSEVSQ